MDESMVFRVAKAISDNLHGGLAWINATTMARAAIEAMREPTDGMRIVAVSQNHLPMKPSDPPLYEAVWRAMLEEALK